MRVLLTVFGVFLVLAILRDREVQRCLARRGEMTRVTIHGGGYVMVEATCTEAR